jgi:hypothetical protein
VKRHDIRVLQHELVQSRQLLRLLALRRDELAPDPGGSVSQDEQLRNMIKRSTLSESKFLHSIGTSAGERKREIVSTVLDKAKRHQETIVKDIGIGTSLTEDDIKNYVEEVEEQEENKV